MTDNTTHAVSADTPLLVATSYFESRKIQTLSGDALRIKPTLMSLGYSLVFIVLGLILVGLWVANTVSSFDGPGSVPLALVGVLFLVAGLGIYYGHNEQILIDRDSGVAFFKSWRPSVSAEKTSVSKHLAPHDIIAIQTISRIVKHRSSRNKRRSTYTEFQVNVCTVDESRHNVFVTLKVQKAKNLADQLAQMFNVPVKAQ